jgi:hypothetical protein
MKKSELRQMIREVLHEELSKKNTHKLTENLAGKIRAAIANPAAVDISELSVRIHQKLDRVDLPEESDMTAFENTTIFKSRIVGDYIIRSKDLSIAHSLEKLADDIYKYERINRYASYEVFQFLLKTLRIPFQVYFD